MTHINRIAPQKSLTCYKPPRARALKRATTRITPLQAELVNEAPIEELVFETNCRGNEHAMRRGYVISELVENIQTEPRQPQNQNAARHRPFWAGFSAAFMTQVIGQHGTGEPGRTNRDMSPAPRPALQQSTFTTLC